MNNLYRIVLLFLLAVSCLHCQDNSASSKKAAEDNIYFSIKNPTNKDWKSETIEVSSDFLNKGQGVIDWSKINFSDGESLPFQLIDEDGNGTPESILLSADLKANGEKKVMVTFSDSAPIIHLKKEHRLKFLIKSKGYGKIENIKEELSKCNDTSSATRTY